LITLTIPGLGRVNWNYLLLDLNGTLALDGVLIEGIDDRIRILSNELEISLITANTHGTAQSIAQTLGVCVKQISSGQEAQQKQALVTSLGSAAVIAIGNGNNDALMLATASLGIAVLGPEGTSVNTLQAADLVAPSIQIALEMLIHPERLAATLRC